MCEGFQAQIGNLMKQFHAILKFTVGNFVMEILLVWY